MSIPIYWREQVSRYRLQGEKCLKCGAKFFPTKQKCDCGNNEFQKYQVAHTGKILTWTVIRNPPKGYEKYQPYIVGLIELDDGIRILSQIVDISPEDIYKNLKVEAVFRRVTEDGQTGILQYGYKFRPEVI
jgi:uncharacterized OB-fold protein